MPSPPSEPADQEAVPRRRRFPRWPFGLEFTMVVAALIFRIWLLQLPVAPVDDVSYSNEITNLAISLSSGHGFSSPFGGQTGPSAWIPPLYPFLCAVVSLLVGGYGKQAVVWLLSMNCVFSAFTCIPLYRAGKLIFGKRVGLIAGWVFALCPYFAKWSVSWIWETTLSALFMTWMFLLTLELRENNTLRNWIKYGVVWGLAMLNNPSVLTLVGVGMLWSLEWGGRAIWRRIAVSALVCAIVISPWLVRNRVAMGRWIFIRSNFGFEFSLGNYYGSKGTCATNRHPWHSPYESAMYARLGEAEYCAQHSERNMEFVREYPREFVRLCWTRFHLFWSGGILQIRPHWRAFWIPALYRILTITTALGLLLMAIRRMRIAYFLFLAIILYPWPYYVACAQARFRHSIEPMMLMVSIYLCVETVRFLCWCLHRSWRNKLAESA